MCGAHTGRAEGVDKTPDDARTAPRRDRLRVCAATVQHLNDFPLYTEAIKFFNHEESMIRVAVRTLTLNVFSGRLRLPAPLCGSARRP